MTGAGNINVGEGTFSGLLSATQGLKIGSVNNWQIKENGGELCFYKSGNAFACINSSGNLFAPKVVTADTATFPTKTTWAVNDKFVIQPPNSTDNTVYRGTITSLPTTTTVNYTAGDGTTNITITGRPITAFNTAARADLSNGAPATSLLRWT
jgi:hypothetical protein